MRPVFSERLQQQIQEYEGKWIALFGPDGEMEIVAAGDDAAEASEAAARKGYTETTLLKVLPADVAYVPRA